MNFFTSLWKNMPQEKLYLQTDKPYYSAGEDIWFKAYVINASTHLPNTLSRYVYVELINAFDSVLIRVKIKKDSLGFSGHLKLDADIATGDYILRAYTYWMQNTATEFFFNKQIKIGNSIDDRLFSAIKFGKIINGFQPVTIQISDVNSKPIVGKIVKLSYSGSKNAIKPVMLKSNSQGELIWRIPVDSAFSNKKIITLTTDEPSLKLSKQFIVPPIADDFDMQFFPESGSLINDNVQTIAFKAIGTNGLSVNVSGKVFDSQNNQVAELNSIYKGMGKFSVFVQSGNNYYALVKNEKGVEKRFSLPKVQDQGVSLQLINNKTKILYDIKNQIVNLQNPLYLLIHSRGIVYAIQPLHYLNGQLNEDNLPAGITSFSVIDSLGNLFCERLYFVKNKQLYNINISSDKKTYKKREKVSFNINIYLEQQKPKSGDFALSVTDNKLVVHDSTATNILTHFLLTSDIKGYVEDPADFFTNNGISSIEKLDLLMLTQAWRRFDLSDYLKRKIKRPNFYLEMGQAVSGKVLNLANKPSKNCDIIMLSSYNKSFRMASTDSLGQFLIEGIEFPDSTSIMLKARKKKSITDVEIIPDRDVFPKSNVFIPYKPNVTDNKLIDYWKLSKEKYYTEGGMRVINLDELTVTASAKSSTDENSLYAGADTKISSETLDKFSGMSILNYLQMVPGVSVMGESVSIRGSSGSPLFLIDGFETENMEDITYLTTNEVEDISVFKGASAAIFGVRGGNGAIAITLKKGITVKYSTPISLSVINPLGFQKPKSFYMPKYDVEEVRNSTKPDLRTTIFWGDNLKIDENGNINVQFFTADPPNNYTFVLEGVTDNGLIIHKSGIIYREETLPKPHY
ncbi:MAG: TonB-dependent receptor plug domain-containing protein [Paludibacter sp.]